MKNTPLLRLIYIALFCFALQFTSMAQTVYVTEGGKKYHMKNCSVVNTGKKGIERSEAQKKGYTSCNVCKPDEKKAAADDPKKKK